MTKRSRKTGQAGEQIARHFLQRKGFTIEAVNWRLGKLGEIDLIVYHPEERLLAFTEVKTRKSAVFGLPEEAVDSRKQARLASLAEAFLSQHAYPEVRAIRFDVISIHFPGEGMAAEVNHIENAFCLSD